MKQRINLYNPHKPKQVFDPLSYRGSLAIAATVAAVFLLLGLGLSFYAGYQQSHVAELSKEKKISKLLLWLSKRVLPIRR